MSALPHVVWDMGGIMYRYFTELLLEVGEERGWPLSRIPLGPTGRVADRDYERMLSGEIDEPGYLAAVRSRLSGEGIDFEPTTDLDWSGQARPETWDAIRQIHDAGHRQALLTNDATAWLGARWWETWEPAGWFEAMVDVVTVGVRKPAPEPYLAAASALGAPTTECLFVDDMPVNCQGAEAVGMASQRFDVTDPQGSISRLLHRLTP